MRLTSLCLKGLFLIGAVSFSVVQSGCTDTHVKSVSPEQLMKILPQSKTKPIVLDFTMSTCGACQQLAPYLLPIKDQFKESVMFIELDVPKMYHLPDSALGKQLVDAFNPRATPTLVAIKPGGVITSIRSRFESTTDIEALFKSTLPTN